MSEITATEYIQGIEDKEYLTVTFAKAEQINKMNEEQMDIYLNALLHLREEVQGEIDYLESQGLI